MSIGQSLAAARERAGLSIADVSERTRIRGPVVEAIERDDFSRCGGDVYARGHIRSLAQAVGADPGALVAEFDSTHQVRSTTASELYQVVKPAPARRPSLNWTALAGAALAVVCVLALVNLLTGPGEDPQAQTQLPGGSTTSTVTRSQPPASPSPSRTPTGDVIPKGVLVEMAIIGEQSWVSVQGGADGDRLLFEGLLDPGARKVFRDDSQIQLRIGNAGATYLTVNGTKLGAAGASGEVVPSLTFGPGDPGELPG